jgi:hypothetical protein
MGNMFRSLKDRHGPITISLAREIARMVHEEYGHSEYVKCTQKDICQAAMDLILVVMAISSLGALTSTPDAQCCRFALNPTAVVSLSKRSTQV